MLLVKAGDEDAFAQLFARHKNTVRNTVARFSSRDVSIEDTVQEVFFRVYRARQRYEPKARFTAWLTTIARNVALNASRSKRRERIRRAEFIDRSQTDGEGDSPPDQVATQAETREFVLAALCTLGERHRRAIQLYAIEGLSYRQIADELDISTTAVKSLLHRARGNLKGQLRKIHPAFDQASA